MERISSRHNPLVARFREAARGADPGGPILLDGIHLIARALECGVPLEVVAVADGRPSAGDPGHAALLTRVATHGAQLVRVTDGVLAALSPVRSPSGIVALAARPDAVRERLVQPAPALVLVVVGVQDPGNLGAIVRAADAAGATGVIATEGSADPFGWKALRGSMGSALRVPIWPRAPWSEAARFIREHALRSVATVPGAAPSLYDVDFGGSIAVLLGAEGQGLPPHVQSWADTMVGIPMRQGVESLNVAVTAALLLYEARRQRTSNTGSRTSSP